MFVNNRCLLLAIIILLHTNNVFANESQQYSIQAPLAAKSLLLDVIKINNKLIAVGERGHILISSDSAKTWQQQNVPTQSTLTSVYFINNKIGWVVGHDAIILKTIDAGKTWQQVYAAPEEQLPLLDIWFKDEKDGIALGAYGYYLETSDGGKTWNSRYISDDDFHLNALDSTENGCLYVAAEAGNVYRSNDNGKNWKSLSTPYEGSFFSIKALDCNTVYVAGLRGNLYQSSDAGETWKKIPLHTEAMLTDIIFNKDNKLVITGLDGLLVIQNEKEEFKRIDTGNRYTYVSVQNIEKDQYVFTSDQGVSVYSVNE